MTISSDRIMEILVPNSNHLGIGISSGSTFLDVATVHENSYGCDPNLKLQLPINANLWKLTSDDFFQQVNYIEARLVT